LPRYKVTLGADFVCLLPLHSAAGMGDRCTRRRIVEQDGDIFTSSFEHNVPPLRSKGTIGCWGCRTWWWSHKSGVSEYIQQNSRAS